MARVQNQQLIEVIYTLSDYLHESPEKFSQLMVEIVEFPLICAQFVAKVKTDTINQPIDFEIYNKYYFQIQELCKNYYDEEFASLNKNLRDFELN